LSAGCKRLEWEKRLTVFFRPLDGEMPAPRDEREIECVVTGVDKAGIVARIARTLADHGANVADLRTELRPEPESGNPIYTFRVRPLTPHPTATSPAATLPSSLRMSELWRAPTRR
jgi:glycine cleavage system regulatory protein